MTREEAIEILGCIYMEVSTDEDKEAVDMAIEALKENESLAKSVIEASDLLRKKRPIGKEEIALNIACDLLIGSVLYGYDFDRIFDEIMERDGCVTSNNIKEFILDHVEELGKEYFVRGETE